MIREVEVPVEKVVFEEKMVLVPEIKEMIVEKVVYQAHSDEEMTKEEKFCEMLEWILSRNLPNSNYLIDFIVWCVVSPLESLYEPLLYLATKSKSSRFFS